MTSLIFVLASGAAAQNFDFGAPVFVLDPDALSWGDNTTIGSPTVVGHQAGQGAGNFANLLLYETRISAPSAALPGCPVGTWGIGLAYRFGGGGFTDAGSVVLPDDDYYTCVAAHPAMVPLDADTWLVYFKAEQNPDTCTALDALNWGCDRYPGVGRFILQYDGRNGSTLFYSITQVDPTPVMTEVAQNMGYPSVMFTNSEYHVLFGQYPDLYLTSSASSSSFSTPAFPEFTAGTSSSGWDAHELHSPALLCNGNASFDAFMSGRTFDSAGNVVDQGVGLYESTNLSTWTESASSPLFRMSDGDDEMRHFTVASSGGYTGFALFYTTPATDGDNELWVSRTPLWDRKSIDQQRCP
jgi:hypothetical protein